MNFPLAFRSSLRFTPHQNRNGQTLVKWKVDEAYMMLAKSVEIRRKSVANTEAAEALTKINTDEDLSTTTVQLERDLVRLKHIRHW